MNYICMKLCMKFFFGNLKYIPLHEFSSKSDGVSMLMARKEDRAERVNRVRESIGVCVRVSVCTCARNY